MDSSGVPTTEKRMGHFDLFVQQKGATTETGNISHPAHCYIMLFRAIFPCMYRRNSVILLRIWRLN